jgi:group I intron endonuclease
MSISGIYKIQSRIKPERIYVGSAMDIHKRWQSHLCLLKRGDHHCKKLQHHYTKYGKSDFVFSIIIGCDRDDLLTTEQFFLDSLNPWFNTCKKAGNTLGVRYDEKTRKKFGEKKKGKPTWNKGKHLSETHKLHIAESQMGENNSFFNKKHSEKTKKIIGEKSIQMHIVHHHKIA